MKKSDTDVPERRRSSTHTASRREILAGAALAGLAVPLAGRAAAKSEHQHHGSHHAELTRLALDCVGHGEACVAHCVKVLGTGDPSLADCLVTVNAMLPMCAALARYAATDAKRLKQLAKVCIDVCDDCAKECEKHAAEHEECKVCGESCVACIKACKKLIAA